jgi:hypothetical protein
LGLDELHGNAHSAVCEGDGSEQDMLGGRRDLSYWPEIVGGKWPWLISFASDRARSGVSVSMFPCANSLRTLATASSAVRCL